MGVGGCLIRSHVGHKRGEGYHKRYHMTERRMRKRFNKALK